MQSEAIQTSNDGHDGIRVGRFVSRAIDRFTCRQGRSDHRYFREVHFTTADGTPLMLVCLVPDLSDAKPDANRARLRAVLETLDAGYKATHPAE